MTAGEPILIGRVAATHGIRGQLRVVSYSGQYDTLCSVRSVLLKDGTGRVQQREIDRAVVHGKKLLLTFAGFSDINQVEQFVGCEIYVTRDQLPTTDDDEYYWYDLIGMKVVTTSGLHLGTLHSIIETGSNDVFVVATPEREYLIPAMADVVTDVDLQKRVMTVTPFEGLLDL